MFITALIIKMENRSKLKMFQTLSLMCVTLALKQILHIYDL
jgi:hypothetical protein